MNIYKRKDSDFYWVKFTINGQQYLESTKQTTKAEATAWSKKYIAELEKEKQTEFVFQKIKRNLSSGTTDWQTALQIFLKYPRATEPGPKQIKRYIKTLSEIQQVSGRKFVNDVTEEDAIQYAIYLNTQKLASRTFNDRIEAANLIFNVLRKSKKVLENPFRDIEHKKAHKIPREIFSEEELERLFNAGDLLSPLVLLMAYTGLRTGDAVRLKWENIDLTGRWIETIQHKTKQKVIIPITEPLYKYLLQNKKESGHLFPELAAKYKSDESYLGKRFKILMEMVGITGTKVMRPGAVRMQSVKDLHSLRHTFAYMAAKNGIPQIITQRILGHATPSMTAMYSDHATRADLQSEINKLNSGIGEAKNKVINILNQNPELWERILQLIS